MRDALLLEIGRHLLPVPRFLALYHVRRAQVRKAVPWRGRKRSR